MLAAILATKEILKRKGKFVQKVWIKMAQRMKNHNYNHKLYTQFLGSSRLITPQKWLQKLEEQNPPLPNSLG